ncbi:chitinase [Nocardiopsis sediminis]|uniref:chitinase n=1 Tax=Nocardiopsis sediminis TaxID=1778267 RepID=A0ABV8FHS5_9ACTN
MVAGLTSAALPASAEPGSGDDAPAASAAEGPWLTGYWHNFDNGSTTLPISDVPEAYNLIAVAFADNLADTPGGITFNLASDELGGYTEQQFKDDIAAAQAQGRKVVISVGGERGHVDVSNSEQAANFARTTYELMNEYGFDGVDIDLEHGINAQYMEEALRALSEQAGPELMITMAPQTIDFQAPTYGYYQLAEAIPDILTIINMQYYNSGSMLGCDGQVYSQGTVDFLTAQACIQLELDLRPDQVGLGVPATPAAAGGGHQSPANVVAALDCLESGSGCGSFTPEQPYGPIGGAMTWSINWDATNGYAFANEVGARLGT